MYDVVIVRPILPIRKTPECLPKTQKRPKGLKLAYSAINPGPEGAGLLFNIFFLLQYVVKIYVLLFK